MDIKTLEQALKLQNDLTARLTQSMVSQRTGKMPAIKATLKEKEELVARAQAEVETAIKERDVAVSRIERPQRTTCGTKRSAQR